MITKSQVKYIQSLGQKKFRDDLGLFVAEGPKIINELLETIPSHLVGLFATEDGMNNQPQWRKLDGSQVTIFTESDLERISFLPSPNSVLGVFKKTKPLVPVFSRQLALMLDGLQDPGNLGTIIRIADWFGISQLICSGDTADAFAPKVIQSSMGSIARVQLCYTDLPALIHAHPEIRLIAASLHGNPLQETGKLKEGVIVIGNESKGIRKEVLEHCAQKITIPRIGKAESLNAAVATGIILSHLL